ncbi:MAG: hypothetical protein ACUVS8_11040 [Armatimonadota bacterium]|jgi:hypothetical protein
MRVAFSRRLKKTIRLVSRRARSVGRKIESTAVPEQPVRVSLNGATDIAAHGDRVVATHMRSALPDTTSHNLVQHWAVGVSDRP